MMFPNDLFDGQGYLFCAEVMPRDHELQLMLVNTIRKVRIMELKPA